MSTTAVPQPRPDWQNDWQQLLSYLPENYEQLAREHKMLEVQYGNAKIKTAQDLLRFVFVHVGCDLPLPARGCRGSRRRSQAERDAAAQEQDAAFAEPCPGS